MIYYSQRHRERVEARTSILRDALQGIALGLLIMVAMGVTYN